MPKDTEVVNTVIRNYDKLLDYDFINKTISEYKDEELIPITKQTMKNVAKWSLNGLSEKEIANNLELTPAKFKILCNMFPVFYSIMSSSRQLADMVIGSSLFETAIGGKLVRKQVVCNVKEYNEYGRVIGEHKEVVWVSEELPPNPMLLKFIAENKLSEKFGKSQNQTDSQVENIINTIDLNTMKEVEKQLKDDNEK